MIVALINGVTLLGGTILLSTAFGWKVGLGVALLVWFHKGEE